jgi:hypothetical protein
MMGIEMWRVAPLLLLFAAGMCNAASIGIVSMNMGGETRLFTLHKLLPDERVYFQYPDKTGATRCCIRRMGKSFELVSTDDDVASDGLHDEPALRYRLTKQPSISSKAPFPGMGVIGRAVQVEQSADKSLKVTSPDGRLTLRSCISQEGLHVRGESDAQLLSDLYFGFDYSAENPTCTK